MIPRLSGRHGATRLLSGEPNTPLPSREDADRIIRQFFQLIERFQEPGTDTAPETKQSRRKRQKTTSPKGRNLHV